MACIEFQHEPGQMIDLPDPHVNRPGAIPLCLRVTGLRYLEGRTWRRHIRLVGDGAPPGGVWVPEADVELLQIRS